MDLPNPVPELPAPAFPEATPASAPTVVTVPALPVDPWKAKAPSPWLVAAIDRRRSRMNRACAIIHQAMDDRYDEDGWGYACPSCEQFRFTRKA